MVALSLASIDAVLLAAGGSARLGRPKQLVRIGGVALVRRAADACLASGARRTHVVVGAHAAAVTAELAGLAVSIVANASWPEGVATSIRAGVAAAASAGADGVLLVLADQPRLRAEILDALAHALAGPASIAACAYADGVGAPAAFGREHFAALAALRGDQGAKALLRGAAVTAIPFPEGVVDVDSEADLELAGADP